MKKAHKQYHFNITPLKNRGLISIMYGGQLLPAMISKLDYVDVEIDVGEQYGLFPSGIQKYAYHTAKDFFDNWNIIERRLLIEKTGMYV